MRKTILLLSVFAMLFACKKSNINHIPTAVADTTVKHCLNIVSPAEQSLLHPAGMQFEWTDCTSDSALLVISYNSNLSHALLDTVLDASSYLYSGPGLVMDTTCYWAVIKGKDTARSYFYTKIYDSTIVGSYVVNVHRTSYGGAQPIDTTYVDTLTVSTSGKGVLAYHLTAQGWKYVWYNPRYTTATHVNYSYFAGYGNDRGLSYWPDSSKISMGESSGGQGGGYDTYASGYR